MIVSTCLKANNKLVNTFLQLQLTIGALVRSKQLELAVLYSSDRKLKLFMLTLFAFYVFIRVKNLSMKISQRVLNL